jgi:hypothetical protein
MTFNLAKGLEHAAVVNKLAFQPSQTVIDCNRKNVTDHHHHRHRHLFSCSYGHCPSDALLLLMRFVNC